MYYVLYIADIHDVIVKLKPLPSSPLHADWVTV